MRYNLTSLTPHMTAAQRKAIDILRDAANLKPMRKVITLNDGTEFEFWHTPLTAAERSKVNKDMKDDAPGEFVLQMLIEKATNANGERLFTQGDAGALRREVREEDLQKLELSILNNENDVHYAPKP